MSARSTTSPTDPRGPAPAVDMLEALTRLPGIRRAWPTKHGDITVECRDEHGRLRAGRLAPDGTVTMLPYATDPALPALSPALEGRLVVHRTARRAVVLAPDRVRKATRPGRAVPPTGAQEAHHAFSALGLRVPRVLAVGDAHADLELVPGRSLAELGDAGLEGWRCLAHVWRGLHRPDADLPVHGPLQEATVLRGWFEHADRHGLLQGLVEDPDALRHAVDTTCDELVEGTPGPMTLSHRDLHDGQLLWSGEELSLIDLDTACLAESELDLGNLVAHAELMGLQGRLSRRGAELLAPVLESLCAAVPTSEARLGLYRRCAALRLVLVHAFRPGARAWLPHWAGMGLALGPSTCATDLRSASCV